MKYLLFILKLCMVSTIALWFVTGVTWAQTNRSIHLSWTDPDASDTSMVITWLENSGNRENMPSYVAYGFYSGVYPNRVASTSAYSENLENDFYHPGENIPLDTYVHRAELTGLMPNTTYYYVVVSGKDVSDEYTFTTGPTLKSKENFRFIVGSDSHSGVGSSRRNQLAYYIMSDTTDPKPGLLFFGGDEITGNNGLVPYQDIKWARQWHQFFSPNASSGKFKGAWAKLLGSIPYMTADSNHIDSDDSLFDLFAYPDPFGTLRLSEKPEREVDCSYFTSFPDQGQRGNSGWYSFNYGNAHFVVLQINTAKWSKDPRFCTWKVPFDSDQFMWLEEDLKNANADPSIRWKFAIWHSAPYSTNGKNLTRNKNIQNTVCRLLTKYDVDMVFAGHQHRYERSKMIINDGSTYDLNRSGHGYEIDQTNGYDSYDGNRKGVVYVVTGGAGNVTPKISKKSSRYTAIGRKGRIYRKAHHYLVVDVDNNNDMLKCSAMGYEVLKGRPIDFSSPPKPFDTFTIEKRQNHLRVLFKEATLEKGQVEKMLPISPPVDPKHAFVMLSASNSHNSNNSDYRDEGGVFQVTGALSADGKNLILRRGGIKTTAITPKAHISYHIVESPDIIVHHGSTTMKKGVFYEPFEIPKVVEAQTIVTLSVRSMAPRKFYHETQVMGDVLDLETVKSEMVLMRESGDHTEVTVEWSAITFRHDVFIQKGWLDFKSGARQEVSIDSIDPSRSWLYFTTSGSGPRASIANHKVRGFIQNSNAITFRRVGRSTSYYPAIQWFVVEFPPESGASVIHGSVISGKQDQKLDAAVNIPKNSFIFHSNDGEGGWYDFARTAWINRMTAHGDEIEFERWTKGKRGTIHWQVVKLPE